MGRLASPLKAASLDPSYDLFGRSSASLSPLDFGKASTRHPA